MLLILRIIAGLSFVLAGTWFLVTCAKAQVHRANDRWLTDSAFIVDGTPRKSPTRIALAGRKLTSRCNAESSDHERN